MTLHLTRTAVLAIHLQKDIVTPNGAFGGFFAQNVADRNVLGVAADVLSAARSAGLPVFYTRVGWDAGHKTLHPNNPLLSIVAQQQCCVNGTWQTEIVDDVAPQDVDIVLTNERVSGLADSPLDTLLRGRGVDTLVLFGVATNLSVEDTARHASNLGYRVILIEDATSAATEEAHRASLETLGLLAEVWSSADFLAAASTLR